MLGAEKREKYTYGVLSLFVLYLATAPNALLPKCPIHSIFNVYCPGCGSTRSLRAILSGHFTQALHENALFILSPILMLAGYLLAKRRTQIALYIYLGFLSVLVVVFTILRNQPHSLFAPL